MVNRYSFLVLAFLMSFNLLAQKEIPERILFVGNSYTYFWNLPQTVELMIEEDNVDVDIDHSTAGGSNWAQHWRGEKDLKTKSRIKNGDYDIVILQNHSMSTINRVDSLMLFGNKLDNLIENSGAETYLYMTWARDYNPYMQDIINKGYAELAEDIDAVLVPVGPAFKRAQKLRPEIALYHFDGSHQSTLGTYLAACVFYGKLTGQSPVGLPHRLITKDQNGELLYLTIQAPNDALFCQKVAEDVLDEW